MTALPKESQTVWFLSFEFHKEGKWFIGELLYDDSDNPEFWVDSNQIFHYLDNVSDWKPL